MLLNQTTAAEALVYGPDPGHQTLREATASWLGRLYHIDDNAQPTPDRIFTTNGASAGIGYLLSRFTDATYTRMIWMVEPTYFLACPVFEQAGFEGRLRGVPEDDQGIDLDYLRNAMIQVNNEEKYETNGVTGSRAHSKKLYRHVIYVVPTFSNPSGKTMSIGRRTELVHLAREFDALIISDDVYDALFWTTGEVDGSPSCPLERLPPRLVDIDRRLPGGQPWGNTASNGSFSKIVAPGMRVGWIECSVDMVRELCKVGPTISGGCQAHLSSMIISHLLQNGGLEKHIADILVPTYHKRSRAMLKSIDKHLTPLGATLNNQGSDQTLAGGFFLYVNLPCDSRTVRNLAQIALEKYNLKVATGGIMAVSGDKGSFQRAEAGFGRGLRLCWAWHEENDIEEGIKRLAAAYKKVQKMQ